MKGTFKIIAILAVTVLLATGAAPTRSYAKTSAQNIAQGPVISFSVFYQSLSPYGRWINYGNYGQVWIPRLGAGFAPYSTNGHWVYTDYGWTWVSDYDWGWGPFHYGRWLYDGAYGWVWVPGNEWAPAWVAWRNSSDYYGWAPLGPGMNIGISIGIPAARWCFIPRRYFGMPSAHRYYMPRARNVTIIHNTTIIRNVNVYENNRYFTGPSRGDVQRATRRSVRPVRVASAPRAGAARVTNRQLNIYRPSVERNATSRNSGNANSPSRESSRPQRTITPNASSRNHITPPSQGSTQPSRSTSQPSTPSSRSQRQSEPTRTTSPRTESRSPSRRIESTSPARRSPSSRAVERAPSPSSTPSRRTQSASPTQRMPSSRAVERASSRSSTPSRPAARTSPRTSSSRQSHATVSHASRRGR